MIIERPMCAARGLEESNFEDLRFPLLASAKLDGIRALVLRDPETGEPRLYSRSLKPIRSAFAQEMFALDSLVGFDGELIAGDPTAADVFNRTTSAVMTHGCQEPLSFYVFDYCLPINGKLLPFIVRLQELFIRNNIRSPSRTPSRSVTHEFVHILEQQRVENIEEMLAAEQRILEQGYEGLILRDPLGVYKYGRSTLREQKLIKLKRLEDAEATVVGFTELQINSNAPMINETGYQRRSSSQEGKYGGDTLGTLVVQDYETGIQFEVGSGFDDTLRAEIWNNKERYKGKTITYKHFPYGRVDKPRQPIFKGFRHSEDM